MPVPIQRPPSSSRTVARTGGSVSGPPRPAPPNQTAGKGPSRAKATAEVEQISEVRQNGQVVGSLAIVKLQDLPEIPKEFPDGPARVEIREGLTIPGPPKSYASAFVQVGVTLPAQPNEEAILVAASGAKLICETLLEVLTEEAADYLLKTYG